MNHDSSAPATFDMHIDAGQRRVRTEIIGRIGLPQVEEFLSRKAAAGAMPFTELIDARLATTALSAHDLHRIVGIYRRLIAGATPGPVAVVVDDNLTYGMARMMAVLIEDTLSLHPFRDVEAAEQWLGWRE